MSDLDQSIRERAYHLWIAAGRPDGQADAYWLEAQRELLLDAMVAPELAAAATRTRKKPADKAVARPRRKTA